MKTKTLVIIGVAALLATVSQAQPTVPPVVKSKVFEFLTATNESWLVTVAPSYSKGLEGADGHLHEWGVSMMGGYWVSPYVVTGLRGDYFAGDLFVGELAATAQQPIKLFNLFVATPFVTTGAAMPVSGSGGDDGAVLYIAGTGLTLTVWGNDKVSLSVMGEVEKWVGALGDPVVYHGGLVVSFKKFWK